MNNEYLRNAYLRRLEMRERYAAQEFERQLNELARYLRVKAGFNPSQPRVPSGNSDGGQWTDGSNGGGEAGRFEGLPRTENNPSSNNLTDVGVSNESVAPEVSEHIQRISAEHNWSRPEKLESKFKRHGVDWGANSEEDFAKKVKEFRETAIDKKLPAIEYNSGEIGIYEPKTNRFGLYKADGSSITGYKPTSKTYFQREAKDAVSRGGRIINPIPGGEGDGRVAPGSNFIRPKKPKNSLPDDDILKNYNYFIERKYFPTTKDCGI